MKSPKLRQAGEHFWKNWLRPLLPVVLVVVTFRSAVADWNDVPTGSMKPSIVEGDRVFVNKLAYSVRFPLTQWHLWKFDDPVPGDVVVFHSPKDGTRLVKRVVAVASDTVEMRENHLFINGNPVGYESLTRESFGEVGNELPQTLRLATEILAEHPHPVMGLPNVVAVRNFQSVTVPEGHFFAMGDNRDNSFDSRFFGVVSRDALLGKATHVVASLKPDDYYLPRWERFFKRLP
jgi:signal peptidase I